MIKECHCCTAGEYKEGMTCPIVGWHVPKDVYRCTGCGHIFRHYKGDVAKFHEDKFRDLHPYADMTKRLERVANLIDIISPYISKEDTSLEIGAGDGMFSKKVTPLIGEISACEIDPAVAERAQSENKDIKVYCGDFMNLEFPKFDVLFAFDVLEHIVDVRAFVEKAHSFINKRVILQVPVGRKIKPVMYRGNFDGHSHYFTEKSIITLFEKHYEAEYIKRVMQNTTAAGPEMICVFKKKGLG